MARRKAFWICDRRTAGVKCATRNPNLKQKCGTCGKPKRKRSVPKHMIALNESYEHYIELNRGERCGICGAAPKTKRLDRDHDHKTGLPRGLLCSRCNRAVPFWMTVEWAEAMGAYLRRHQDRLDELTEESEVA